MLVREAGEEKSWGALLPERNNGEGGWEAVRWAPERRRGCSCRWEV